MLSQARVGGALSNGDYQGAARAAFALGDLETGGALQRYSQQQEQLARRSAVGGQLAEAIRAPGSARAPALREAQAEAYEGGDLDLGGDIDGMISRLDEQERAAAARRMTTLADAADGLLALQQGGTADPTALREALVSSYGPQLTAAGFTPEQMSTVDLSRENLMRLRDAGLDLADRLTARRQQAEAESQNADRQADNTRADAELGLRREQFGETVRHNRAGEGVAAGNLALARQRESRAASGRGSGPAGDGGVPPPPAGFQRIR